MSATQADPFLVHMSLRGGMIKQLDLQNSVTIDNKSSLGLFVELISWFGLQSVADNLIIFTLQQR